MGTFGIGVVVIRIGSRHGILGTIVCNFFTSRELLRFRLYNQLTKCLFLNHRRRTPQLSYNFPFNAPRHPEAHPVVHMESLSAFNRLNYPALLL